MSALTLAILNFVAMIGFRPSDDRPIRRKTRDVRMSRHTMRDIGIEPGSITWM